MIHINNSITSHARRRLQQRGKRLPELEVVYRHGDRERRAGAHRRAVSLSRAACRELVHTGVAAALVERASRLELVVSEHDGHVITVLNGNQNGGRRK